MTGVVDAWASKPHYVDHVRPVWEALPAECRGIFWGVDRPLGRRDRDRPVIIAGSMDHEATKRSPVILLEHGAGQTYPGDSKSAGFISYAGGAKWDHAIGFVTPGQAGADRWAEVYAAPAVAVGCPTLDRWHGFTRLPVGAPVVAFLFHWDCTLVPETRSAWGFYAQRMGSIVSALNGMEHRVIATAHPRWNGALRMRFDRLGVEYFDQWADVMERASVLCVDNSSTMYEFAATGRPVVALSAPWYRRDVEHGLRFWSHIPGIEISDNDPHLVANTVQLALDDPPELAERRRAGVAAAYAHLDGGAAERAAAFILTLI